MESEVIVKARAAHEAARQLAAAPTELKNRALMYIADALEVHRGDIMSANEKDVDRARAGGMGEAMLDRLSLTEARIKDMARGVRQVVGLEDPTGICLDDWNRPNGLHIRKITVPLGVVAIIYESRPNVTVDAAVLCIKSGNACILRGGSESIHSNMVLVSVLKEGLSRAGLNADGIGLLENTDRALVKELLTLRDYIDMAIPRGGAGLIRMVVTTATVPCIETGSGVCHVYVDKDADLDMAVRIVENAKVSRPSTCNAMETLLVHQDVIRPFLQKLMLVLTEKQVELRGDNQACAFDDSIKKATEVDWGTEYNALIMSVKTVSSLKDALDHIRRYSTHHSEAIVTNNKKTAELFLQDVDSAAVYVNASTRFTDGFEFGFGAEIGISTQKLHVRGPMGLTALVTYKYVIHGQGQIR
ncbi:gamma-glutamyl phosphate reductase [Megasphaera cerevisiae DSM 20462]|uniref:Gamma-glutamyl phosphate reductase n=1 Tax=Megasphaera cerevisiae DSM 20462 TaxID=1122219 RepID=A0A0J6WW32_9FIRM|nr:glutamate-5-semialdehyde dehydrogenase [Megasphaera cerevisiae]KMO86794.1 gamma-glutamyl phosphate reductase [Megasphaera cerevisiae DSM 20462]SJZ35509.1 glutamate-5-semialdehyde dehydrogenase [Megasphaera cerevisiae DSM 20462]